MRFSVDFSRPAGGRIRFRRFLIVGIPAVLLALAAIVNAVLAEQLKVGREALARAQAKVDGASPSAKVHEPDKLAIPGSMARALQTPWDDYLTFLESLSRPGWHIESFTARAEDAKAVIRMFQSPDATDQFPVHALEAATGRRTVRIVSHERTDRGVRWTIELSGKSGPGEMERTHEDRAKTSEKHLQE